MLVPPPAPSWKPNSAGGTTGALGVGPASSVMLRPQPVCNSMLFWEFKKVLVPPTPVTNGESALAFTDTELIPKAALSSARLSPESPLETCWEIPKEAASSEMPFSIASSAGSRSTSLTSVVPKLLESTLPNPFSTANRFAASRLESLLLGPSTSTMLAPGAMACAHSTSIEVSNCQFPASHPLVAVQVAVPGPAESMIWKFDGVSKGSEFNWEKRFASDKMVL